MEKKNTPSGGQKNIFGAFGTNTLPQNLKLEKDGLENFGGCGWGGGGAGGDQLTLLPRCRRSGHGNSGDPLGILLVTGRLPITPQGHPLGWGAAPVALCMDVLTTNDDRVSTDLTWGPRAGWPGPHSNAAQWVATLGDHKLSTRSSSATM